VIDFSKLYARHAEQYDAARTGAIMERPYLEAVRELRPPPGSVLDLGCGSGEPIARYFADHGYQVTGVDLVEEMLDLCRSRFPHMTWLRSDMRELNLEARFDVVVAWDSFFHLRPDDQRAMLGTFRRHAVPGGVLMFTSGLTEGEGIGGDLFGDQLYHASLDTSEYRELLTAHGYRVIRHCAEDPDCGGHTVWMAQLRADIHDRRS
jgi:ubiquinone/menaquinone biosynthesis C-methylase UbiE